MSERVQIPFDTNSASDKEKEEGHPKTLGMPKISDSLRKPKMGKFKARLYRHCNCGSLTCQSPYQQNERWYWVYRDMKTNAVVHDPNLPKWGPDGDGWTRKGGGGMPFDPLD